MNRATHFPFMIKFRLDKSHHFLLIHQKCVVCGNRGFVTITKMYIKSKFCDTHSDHSFIAKNKHFYRIMRNVNHSHKLLLNRANVHINSPQQNSQSKAGKSCINIYKHRSLLQTKVSPGK